MTSTRWLQARVAGGGHAAAVVFFSALVALTGCGRSGLRTFPLPDGGINVEVDGGSGGAGGSVGGAGGGAGGRGGTVGGAGGTAGGAGGAGGGVLVQLIVSPESVVLPVGGTTILSAVARYSDGTTVDATTTSVWTSSDDSVARVVAGRVSTLRGGGATVTANFRGLIGTAKISVTTSMIVTGLRISPPLVTLMPGGSQALTATAVYSDGTTGDVTALATWNAAPVNVASMNRNIVVARSAGQAAVIALYAGFTAQSTVRVASAGVVQITVTPPMSVAPVGTYPSFRADATLSDGSHQDVTFAASWQSSDASVAVSFGGGSFYAQRTGSVTISATYNGFTGRAFLGVSGPSLVAIQVDPMDPSVGLNVPISFHATGIYADGSNVDLTARVVWSSSSPRVVAVDGAGNGVTRSVGAADVSATFGGVTGSTRVTVNNVSLRTLVVSPPDVTLSVGGSAILRAFGTYSDGTTLDLTDAVAWNASPEDVVGTPDTTGAIYASNPGSAVITATFGGVSGSAKVTVSPSTLTGLTILPSAVSVPVGISQQLTAIGFFSDGNTRDVTAEVSWSSGDDRIATVSNLAADGAGVVTGVAAGQVAVTASSMGIAARASISVVGATLQFITVQPDGTTITTGDRINYTAIGSYSDGRTLDITTQVTWLTGDSSVATISNAPGNQGSLLGRGPGSTEVIATLGPVTGSTSLAVIMRVVAVNLVLSGPPSTPLGVAVQYSVVARFSDGSQRDVTGEAMWSSTAPGVATVSAGRVVPAAEGQTTITASFENLMASLNLRVTPPTVTLVQVTPVDPTVAVGSAIQFAAVASFSDGSRRDVTAAATWSSSAPRVVNVGNAGNVAGRATAVSQGGAVVTATYMNVAGRSSVTVSGPVLVDLRVEPFALTLPVGSSAQMTATAVYSDGSTRDVTALATWTSSAPGVASVGDTMPGRGRVTAVASGNASIRADLDGLARAASVVVP